MKKRYREELEAIENVGNGRVLRGAGLPEGVINLSSNDYLAVAQDLLWQEEFFEKTAGQKNLLGATSSRLLSGTHTAHTILETTLEKLYQKPSLTFSTGYQMNSGILPAIVNKNTLVLADKLCHASIIDGLRLCNCQIIRYIHHNHEQLERLLAQHHHHFEQIIIVTESVFSMDGDIAPVGRLVELKRRYKNVLLYIDEAHAVGVYGLGIAQRDGVLGDIDILCGTFGKALGGVGGYVVCDDVMKKYLINRCRTLIFTTALPPINALWGNFVLEKLEKGELKTRAEKLLENSTILQRAIAQKGYQMPSESHIIPLILGDSKQTVAMANELQKNGFYVLPIRPPTVPENTARLRFSLTSGIEKKEIEQLITLL